MVKDKNTKFVKALVNSYNFTTKGNVYEVVGEDKYFYEIKSNFGVTVPIFKNSFEVIDETS